MKYCLVNETDKEILLLGSIEPCESDEDVDTYFDLNLREDAYALHRLLAYLWNHPEIEVYVCDVQVAPDYIEVESVE